MMRNKLHRHLLAHTNAMLGFFFANDEVDVRYLVCPIETDIDIIRVEADITTSELEAEAVVMDIDAEVDTQEPDSCARTSDPDGDVDCG